MDGLYGNNIKAKSNFQFHQQLLKKNQGKYNLLSEFYVAFRLTRHWILVACQHNLNLTELDFDVVCMLLI